MAAHLPAAIQQVPKRGFELPLGRWLLDLEDPPLAPQLLGDPWPSRVRIAHRRYQARPHRYHGWWQWQVLARWLAAWPALLATECR
jgi:hypothetical protein